MSQPLMSIGMYADAVGLPASALRYYDEIGLLVPEQVDSTTGYRWYTTATVERARRIRDLRAVGLSVGTMRTVLDADSVDAAAVLVSIADRREREGVEAVAVLRSLADEILSGEQRDRSGPEHPMSIDGPRLAEALRSAAGLCGPDAPVDRVLLEATPGQLGVLATDRFRLFSEQLPCPGHLTARPTMSRSTMSRSTMSRTDVEAVASWAERQTEVSLQDGPVPRLAATYGDAPVALTAADSFPDLSSLRDAWHTSTRLMLEQSALLAALAAAAELCSLTVDRAASAGTARTVRLDGTAVGWLPEDATPPSGDLGFTTALLVGAIAPLAGETCSLGVTQPLRPCVLWGTTQPARRVMVMPARRDERS